VRYVSLLPSVLLDVNTTGLVVFLGVVSFLVFTLVVVGFCLLVLST